MLRTPISLALLNGIVQTDARIELPEVIEKEILIKTEQRGIQFLNKIFKLIESLTYYSQDTMSAIEFLPTKDTISEAMPKRLEELSAHIICHNHSYSEMQTALDMVLKGLPPNTETNQQYKDSLMWQAVLSLAERYCVHLVTRDKGFFKNSSYADGPAENLAKDIESKENRIEIHHGLESCTAILRTFDRPLDEELIYERILHAVKNEIDQHLAPEGFFPKSRKRASLRSFFTSDPSKIAIQFYMEFELGELYQHEEVHDPWMNLHGNCLVSQENLEISNLKIDGMGWKIRAMSSSSLSTARTEAWPGDGTQIYGEIK